MIASFALAALFMACAMALAWFVRQKTGQSGWIDCIWTAATATACGGLALAGGGPPPARGWMIAAMAAFWGARLALHIARRTLGGGDDPRYADLARQWGANFRARLFWFLQIQAACGFALAVCGHLAARNPAPFPDVFDAFGAIVFFVALAGESLADRQLAAFRAAGIRGGICELGLWGWSRHPNYFFEWLIWVGFALIAIDPVAVYWPGFFAVCGPALMYWLLVHASGIPPLEAHMSRSRGAAFASYQARVSAFFPWPPRIKAREP